MKEQQRDDSIDFRVQPPAPSKSSATRPLWWIVAAIAVVSTVLAVLELKQITALQQNKTQIGSELSKAQEDLRAAQAAQKRTDKENEGLKSKLDEANTLITDLKGQLTKKKPLTNGQAQSQGNQDGAKNQQKPGGQAKKK
jgi:peptidoglycan hydrolase CwlO-like protein